MKRFWQEAVVTPERGVALDGRPVRTPARVPLILPTVALADAVASEWRGVGDTLDPRAMPLTGLANAAIDRIAPDPAAFTAGLARFAETDLLAYRADHPDELVERQSAAWDPPLAWARARYDVQMEVTTGIVHHAQPPATVTRLGGAIAALDAWALAACSPIVMLTGSLILTLAINEDAIAADAVWAAAELDEAWQTERWGDDPLAADRRIARCAEFDAAVSFLRLAAGR